jgi:hypothetical protein
MTTLVLAAALLVPLLWLAHRLQGALVAMRRLPDVAPDIAGRDLRTWPADGGTHG